ncbi:MAG TPA: protein kinase [Bacteroidia bacterium]|jgi:serine/threonine protein kinase|nr:protein kinase [Bacteroidia bacterium]
MKEKEDSSLFEKDNTKGDINKSKPVVNKSVSKNKKIEKSQSELSDGGHSLSALGKKTAEIIKNRFIGNALFNIDDKELIDLADSFRSAKWTDENISELLQYVFDQKEFSEITSFSLLNRWILSHPNEVDSIKDCMSVKPPKDFQIIKVLSKAGSQKLVFLAQWTIAQKQVVLKALKGDQAKSETIIERESQAHPFNIEHDNIIETHIFQNDAGRVFLVEEKLPNVLSDKWYSEGITEAANLLHDIAKALYCLHVKLGKVHGDIKPDNIGRKNDDYILLDFGICRSADKFMGLDHPSGSLRTRAPELLVNGKYTNAYKVDIWALGATVYNTLYKRFPLYEVDEIPPRGSKPEERELFEEKLKQRVLNEWDKYVTFNSFSEIQKPIDDILMRMLEREPEQRITASELIDTTSKNLAALIRNNDDKSGNKISPLDELNQLKRFLPDAKILKHTPSIHREKFKSHLEELKKSHGLPKENQDYITELIDKISSNA